MNDFEIWKDIPEYEGLYQASNLGRIKSLDRSNRKGRILKNIKHRSGYLNVNLCKNGIEKFKLVHILVWTAFNGSIPEGYEINHIDENTENARLDNLELVTHSRNMNCGTIKDRISKTLTNGARAKIVLQYSIDGEYLREFMSLADVKRKLGFPQSNISKCCYGEIKQAYGYIWKYKQ